ncbi:hypothetical protein [Sphingomonas chungangi]|uniref:hypothetical protein n=1 Tax=Sphingomonas chungangi TaxID=2683589 RepID=UPI001365CB4F|nr:hypothetical protein [Sphingomonas chungangi]
MASEVDTAPRTAARLLAAGASTLGVSVLLDSAMEHYRGSFRNPAMALPLAASAISIAFDGSGRGGGFPRTASHSASVAIGLTGLGFHTFNVFKRPSGLTFNNLFYGAPIGAPGALILSGLLGAASDRLSGDGGALGSGRLLAGLAAFGIFGSVGEAGLLHLKGSFQNPAMWLPVTIPPLAAASLAVDAMTGVPRPWTTALLGATALVGTVGVAFHAYGVSRNMGGWRNWRQNLLAGPPMPAPPAFAGLAIAALGAVLLMRRARG